MFSFEGASPEKASKFDLFSDFNPKFFFRNGFHAVNFRQIKKMLYA